MATVICVKCRKQSLGSWTMFFRCPDCKKVHCNDCLIEPGVGFIRRGFCPHCGTEIQDVHQHKD